MEKIKGLIIKDILQLKTYRRTIVLYIAIFIFSSFIRLYISWEYL